jgi:hypothetical protein
VIVVVAQDADSVDQLSAGGAVQYGGVTMTRLHSLGRTSGEVARTYAYFLGSGIPTGAQTFSVNSASATDVSAAWCITVTAGANTEMATGGAQGGDALNANPAVTIGTGAGFSGFVAGVCFSGVSAPGSLVENSPYQVLTKQDFGVTVAAASHAARSGANVLYDWTAVSDDWCISAVAIQEASGAPILVPGRALRGVGA